MQALQHTGAWYWDLASDQVTCSDGLLTVLGFADGTQLDLQDMLSGLQPEDQVETNTLLQDCIQQNRPYEAVHAWMRPDKQLIWIRARGNTVRNPQGDVLGLAGTSEDITVLHQTSEKLELLQKAVNQSREGITIADFQQPNEPLIYANQGFYNLTGYSEAQVIGQNCRYLQGKDEQPEARRKMREAFAEHRGCVVELRNYNAQGQLFWNLLSLTPVKNRRSELTHYIGVQFDITALKEAQLKLERARNQLAQLNRLLQLSLQVGRLGTFQLNLLDDTIQGDDTFRELFGISPAEPITLDLYTRYAPAETRECWQAFARLQEGENLRLEYQMNLPEQGLRWYESYAESHQLEEDPYLIGTVRDITEQREAEHKRQELAELQIRQQTMNEILSLLAHQWRQPLGTISMLAANIQLQSHRKDFPQPQITEQAVLIQRQASSLSQTIREVRQLFVEVAEEPASFLWPELLQTLIDELQPRWQLQRIEDILTCAELPPLQSHDSFVQAICRELLVNATEALERLPDSAPRRLQLRLWAEPERQVLEVQDNAGGIACEPLQRIFDPYYSTKETLNGAGLGLFTSRMLCKLQLQGSLTVVNQEGGACFQLSLPQLEPTPLRS